MNKIRYIWFIISAIIPLTLSAENSAKDSLQTLLVQTTNPQQRIDLLLKILDLSNSASEEFPVSMQLYKESKLANDKLGIAASLSSITISYMENAEKEDSLMLILNEAEQLLKNSSEDGVATYYKMTLKARILQTTPREQRPTVCNRILEELNAHKETETPYEKSERLFLTGVIHYLLTAMTEKINYRDALSYWEEGWEITKTFAPSARKSFAGNLYIMLSVSYNSLKDSKRFMEVSNEYLHCLDNYFNQEEIRSRRPYYYKDNLYILCYQQLMLNHNLIGRAKAHEYYLKYCDYIQHGKGDVLLKNKLFFYDLSRSYFTSIEDYPQALSFCDSLIQLVQTGEAMNVSSVIHYKNKATLLQKLGRTEEACQVYERAIFLTDSLSRKEQLNELGEMQAQNEMARLQLEKANLTTQTRNIALFSTLGLIVMAIVCALYFYFKIKHIRKLQQELIAQTHKAQESEHMKSAFIKSICNEVRSPLNSITIHTSLITSDSLSNKTKIEYSEQIHEDCKQLTNSLDHMLETAYHQSSGKEKKSPTA